MIKEEDTLNALRLILKSVGEDASREGLLETPQRILKSWATLYGGYKVDPDTILKTFEADGYNEIILLKNIEMYSMCEHHMLPFIGKAHVAYIPNKRVVGISKLARVVEMFSRRMQIQERLTEQVASFIQEKLEPKAVACIIEAQHLCMLMRGVNKQNSVMVTSSLKGEFLLNQKAREELMNLIKI